MWWIVAERLPFGTIGQFLFWVAIIVLVGTWLGGVPL